MAPSIDLMKMRMVEHAVLTSTLLYLTKICFQTLYQDGCHCIQLFSCFSCTQAHTPPTHTHRMAEFKRILSTYDQHVFSRDAPKFWPQELLGENKNE